MNESYLKSYLKKTNALWEYEGGNFLVELASGKYSTLYVNNTSVIQNPAFLELCVQALIAKANLTEHIDWVIGSAMGGIPMAYEFARQLKCQAGFTEKDGSSMILKRFNVHGNVLVVEDVITTGGTTEKTMQALLGNGIKIIDKVPCLVNRTNKRFSWEIIPLTFLQSDTWEPGQLPEEFKLCSAVKAKGNWPLLINKHPCTRCSDGIAFPVKKENNGITYRCKNCGTEVVEV